MISVVPIQLNLDLTEWMSNSESESVLQHDCLYIVGWKREKDVREIISYCISERPSKWNIQKNSLDKEFTFADLSKLNISSQHLYLWSAPIEIVENYQLYLNQLPTLNETSMASQPYYNCTLPTFGSMCQYSLDSHMAHHISLDQIIYDLDFNNGRNMLSQTCYTHLQCNLGVSSLCIGWINICDGIIHCIDGIDEEHCWQLEINECKENEYRCTNGQCITSVFFQDNTDAPDCLDASDEFSELQLPFVINPNRPLFQWEEIVCLYLGKLSFGTVSRTRVWCNDAYVVHFPQLIFSDKSDSMAEICWSALKCYLQFPDSLDSSSNGICHSETCKKIIDENCPDMFYMPSAPVAFGHIYFAYTKEYILNQSTWTDEPEYVCYNEHLCGGFYPNRTLLLFNNTTCRRPHDFPFEFRSHLQSWESRYVPSVYDHLYKCNTILRNDSIFCDRSTMYQCVNSYKCIAKIRLFDGKNDCDYGDDERWISGDRSCPIGSSAMYINCTTSNKCISRKLMFDGKCDCGDDIDNACDDESSDFNDINKHIGFPTICNGIPELQPVIIDGQNETDETSCELWLCNNTYTRCNNVKDCLNGDDEVDCYPSSLFNCSIHGHACFSSETSEYLCLSIDKINDGYIDCLGAIDEPQLCEKKTSLSFRRQLFCKTDIGTECLPSRYFCDGREHCVQGEDEKSCYHIKNLNPYAYFGICDSIDISTHYDAAQLYCDLFKIIDKPQNIYFWLHRVRITSNHISNRDTNMVLTSSLTTEITHQNQSYCHHGHSLRVWLNKEKNQTNITCLCPVNYYGDRCQYQNQRVSLTIQFRAFSDSWRTPFTLIVLLIDNSTERTIHSHEQLTYLPVPNCKTKFRMDLHYSTRPKNESKQYSIHIDIYEKLSLLYRGSLLVPMPFLFLPVQRIAVQLNIPRTSENFKSCSSHQCVHGQCIRYFDDPKLTEFCQCTHGWSGRHCNILHNCTCSPDSLCLGILANNRSICACPMNKWGSRCLLDDQICQSNTACNNRGQCISVDRYALSNKKFVCICSKGFSGQTCEISQNKIILSFEKDIILPQSIYVHFIEVKDNAPPENGTTFKSIPITRDPVTVYWSRPFDIAFVEFFPTNYYLIVVQNANNQSKTIERLIKSSDRCPHISEVFNETFSQVHLLRRIKSYHQPCQKERLPRLSCFFDDVYICLCNDFGHQRQANCFEFNHKLKRNCHGQSNCENGATCLQDSVTCPEISMCVCPSCFYGARCQFSSNGFSLSLDAIMGAHIQPHISINHQPVIVHISITLIVLMTTIGFINGIFSIITFNNKDLCKVGCGIYLIGSSITTLLTMTLLSVKFWILIAAQMTYMTNRSFLHFQCVFIDYFLRVGLNMDQWLNACVAIERAITAIKGVNFDKKKSKRAAKFAIILLLCLTISTNIQDPLFRRLIDEDNNDENRIWCIVTYSPAVEIFNLTMNIFHFCAPFLINLSSAVIIIIMTARLRTSAQAKATYREILRKQFDQHKHLLISSLLLVILTTPRLIISFASGCMKSAADSWLFLIGYFISFIPSMLTFLIFVVPSKTYTKEFYNTVRQYRQTMQAGLSRFI